MWKGFGGGVRRHNGIQDFTASSWAACAGVQASKEQRVPEWDREVIDDQGRAVTQEAVLDVITCGSSLAMRSFSRMGSGMSMLDFVTLGSSLSLRAVCRLGSSFSAFGAGRFGTATPRNPPRTEQD